jgi:hypothetical protein
MKALFCHSLILIMMVSCAAPASVRINATVGPQTHSHPGASDDGALKVFSVREMVGDVEGPISTVHSGYEIVTDTHRRVRFVKNSDDSEPEQPVTVSLRAGRYLVKTHAKSLGRVEVPVLIKPGQITIVRLDGDKRWLRSVDVATGGVVTLPNGKAIGWRAEDE